MTASDDTGGHSLTVAVGPGTALTTLDAHLLAAGGDGLTIDLTGTSTTIALTGTGGDDTFTFGTSLTASDDINGVGGTDTLSATLGSSFTATAGHLDNVSELDFTLDAGMAGATVNVDVSASTAVDLLDITAAQNDTTSQVTVQDAVTEVDLHNGSSSNFDVTVSGITATS